MSENTIGKQIYHNAIALTSLIVAIIAISYNTWRTEVTEENRNFRTADFEILNQLGQLQLVVNSVRYQKGVNPLMGWGHISFASDLSKIVPPPVPYQIAELVRIWGDTWQTIQTNDVSADKITQQIDKARDLVLHQLKNLK